MRFKGSDGSALLWDKERDSINIIYKSVDGLTFKDIAYDDSITLYENLWLFKLKSSGIEALDVYMLYKASKIDMGRLKKYRALKDIARTYNEVQQNILILIDFLAEGNHSPFGVITQAQKHLERLRRRIEEQEETIYNDVIFNK